MLEHCPHTYPNDDSLLYIVVKNGHQMLDVHLDDDLFLFEPCHVCASDDDASPTELLHCSLLMSGCGSWKSLMSLMMSFA